MIVDKNSWHSRLRDFPEGVFSDSNMTLCKYFWQVVATPFLLLGVCVVIVIVSPFIAISWLKKKITGKGIDIEDGVLDADLSDLVPEFVMAKYRKVCPLIEFKEKEGGE